MPRTAVVWHRADLRLHDHPAVIAGRAADRLVGLVVLDPRILDATSDHRAAWFETHVAQLREHYEARGSALAVRHGPPEEVVPAFAEAAAADHFHAIRSYTPYGRWRDRKSEAATRVGITWHDGDYVHEPGSVTKKNGSGYSVFSPFFRRWAEAPPPELAPTPRRLPPAPRLDEGGLKVRRCDIPLPPAGERAALSRLTRFLRRGLPRYRERRDQLAENGTSDLSSYLAVGALSPRTVAHRIPTRGPAAAAWRRQLAWRDFLASLLADHPTMATQPIDERWRLFPWRRSRRDFEAWKSGQTGVPLVDAGMRELAATGRMHNRARMVCAQFLAKQLMLPWTWGEQHFKHQLLDGDTAQNIGNWQWSAGLGVDAAPYFRVLNPVTQAKRFDPEGRYLRRWVPECDGKPDVQDDAVVDLKAARERYLAAARLTLQKARGGPR